MGFDLYMWAGVAGVALAYIGANKIRDIKLKKVEQENFAYKLNKEIDDKLKKTDAENKEKRKHENLSDRTQFDRDFD